MSTNNLENDISVSEEKTPVRVFINCPFDDEYKNILHVLIFLVSMFKCLPTLASVRKESADRMSKIVSLIKDSSIGIHDICRMEHTDASPLARFNMPFELGLDYAYRHYCSNGEKKLLIMEEKPYLSKQTLSDLSGTDIKAHSNKTQEVIKIVRDFFCDVLSLKNVPAPGRIHTQYYTSFHVWLRTKLIELGYDENEYLKEIDISDFICYTNEYFSIQN